MSAPSYWTGSVPSKCERRRYLRARGWTPVGTAWRHDRYGAAYFFTLANAYRVERGLEEQGS